MLGFQGLAVQPFLKYAFPCDDMITGSPDLVLAQHFLQEIFSPLFLLGDSLQFFTGFVILSQQINGGIRQSERCWETAQTGT